MSVHYRFKSALEYDTITFDGLHISVKDLKNAIIQQKRIGKSTDFDLQVTNAQTKDVYDDENTLIPKNTSLLIARIPVAIPKAKQWEGYGGNDTPPAKLDDGGPIAKAVDLSSLDAPEDDKIKAMMLQSTQDYDPSNYSKIRGSNQVGPVPPNYRCYKCHQGGHWIKDCPLGQGTDAIEIKKPTGIPVSLLVPVEGPQVQGAMMTPNGQYAVPVLDHQAYTQKNTNQAPVQEQKPEIPEDLLCSICSDLMTDAVMIPCCGNSFCDECIRGVLLESDDHECPDCHEKDISPTTLIPNRFLRKSVANFKNTTGYERKFQPTLPKPVMTQIEKKAPTPPPEADTTEKEKELTKEEEKTVISEADSTEQAKSEPETSKEIESEHKNREEISEDPPGVSPSRHSPGGPKFHITSKINSHRENKENRDRRRSSRERRDSRERSMRHYKSSRPDSPRKHHHRSHHSPKYDSGTGEERPGTPIRDEPNLGNYPTTSYNSNMGHMHNMGNMPSGHIPGPMPPNVPPPGYPPNQGPPSFRLPPPGGPGAPPYMPPGAYPMPPRPMFDPTRPPMAGPPPFSGPPPYGGPRPHREFGSRRRDRTPPGIIDDPLAAFNRILREKDERRRRRRRGSWSRSRSRSRSYSRSPKRNWSRSPRRRQSRSRSRSFSMSRSRSRSYHSPGGRAGSPPYRGGALSPGRRSPGGAPRRGGPPRYHSPPRLQSPPRRRERYKDRRDDREYEKDRGANRGNRGDQYYDRRGNDRQQWHGGQGRAPDGYFPPIDSFQNRYPPPGDFGPPQPRPVDIAQPPIPGLENEPMPLDKFDSKPAPPEKQEPSSKDKERRKSRSKSNDRKARRSDRDKGDRDKSDRDKGDRDKKDKSRSPEKWRNPSPKSRSRTPEKSPDKHRKKRKESSSENEDKKKSKDKKRHKDKKDRDKKKKDKKDKHRRSDKDKKSKDEFKQVIPKLDAQSSEDLKKIEEAEKEKLRLREEEDKKLREEEIKREEKRVLEEKKKEERRLRFLEEERRIKLEEEERKRKEEEARKKKEEEEIVLKQTQIEEKLHEENTDEIPTQNDIQPSLYDDEFSNITIQPPQETIEEQQNVVEEEEEEESGVLEIHSSEMDLKVESDILAPLPEKSRWEVEEEGQTMTSPQNKEKIDNKTQKVSNEVLKRAENAIFAKAINAIRPIEIKKVSADRAKLYMGEREVEKKDRSLEVTIPAKVEVVNKIDLTQDDKPKLSVKDRLGVKVNDDSDRVIKVGRDRSRTISPFSRRERRLDDEFRRHDRNRRSRSRRRDNFSRRDYKKDERSHRVDRKDKNKHKDKRKRSRSKSESEDHKKKRKDKKTKKDKSKKDNPEDKTEPEIDKPKQTTSTRKPTLDEANFIPDYDLELHNTDEEDKNQKDKTVVPPLLSEPAKKEAEESSSSESDSSSSDEDHKKKKKHKKHRKKKRRESSSSDNSSDESSDDERKKKQKKSKKKKKKAKHK